ncbi:TetR family transcriptional regulator [Streptomyces sp. NPDC005438]|uniref:TetR family transcriptional regulator n=1 Tax=Streptomyces sp. NPDC005438 TaxID=3156880 RepID=UPI0033BC0CDB
MTPAPHTRAPGQLTERQAARRRRIVEATTTLAREGGYDAVQMRAVAETSQVALGTLYRYFPSKVHLLVATMRDQLERLHHTLHAHPPRHPRASDRVAHTLLRAFETLQHEPLLADAMLRALNFADQHVSEEVASVSRLTTALIEDAIRLEEEPSEERLSAVRVIGHTWHSVLIGWLTGRATMDQVRVDLHTVCQLVDLPSAPAPRGSAHGARG